MDQAKHEVFVAFLKEEIAEYALGRSLAIQEGDWQLYNECGRAQAGLERAFMKFEELFGKE